MISYFRSVSDCMRLWPHDFIYGKRFARDVGCAMYFGLMPPVVGHVADMSFAISIGYNTLARVAAARDAIQASSNLHSLFCDDPRHSVVKTVYRQAPCGRQGVQYTQFPPCAPAVTVECEIVQCRRCILRAPFRRYRQSLAQCDAGDELIAPVILVVEKLPKAVLGFFAAVYCSRAVGRGDEISGQRLWGKAYRKFRCYLYPHELVSSQSHPVRKSSYCVKYGSGDYHR